MRIILLHSLVILSPGLLWAQFTNFPLHETYTNADWYTVNQSHPIMQLYSAAVERIELINNGGSTLAPLNMSATYVCGAGTNQTLEGSYTNWILAYTNITLTNCFTNFTYTYSDFSGTHTATGRPYITRSQLAALDTAILSLIPYFVSTNAGAIGTPIGNYLTNKYWDVETDVIPMESQAGLFARQSIGFSHAFTTNAYGWTNGGSAVFTRGNEGQFGKVLLSTAYTTNGVFPDGWQLSFMEAITPGVVSYLSPHEVGGYAGGRGVWVYDNTGEGPVPVWTEAARLSSLGYGLSQLYKPVLTFLAGGTNSFTSVQYQIWGEYITDIWQTASIPYVESGTMTSSTFALSKTWVFVSNIVITAAGSEINDTYTLEYTNNPVTLYGERPYSITTSDMDERWKVLKALKYTKYGNGIGGGANHPGVSHLYAGQIYNGPDFWAAYTNWSACLADASNSLAASTNWITLTNNTTDYMFDYVTWYTNIDNEYFIDVASGPATLADTHPVLTNVYTSISKIYSFYWGDQGVVGGVNYFRFSGAGAPREDVFCNLLNVTTPDSNAFVDSYLNYYRNPVAGIASPTNALGGFESRKQTQSDWFFIMDWSSGLKYK